MKALRYLKHKSIALTFANSDYAKMVKGRMPIGNSFKIPLPPQYQVVTSGDLAYAPQPLTQLTADASINRVSKIHFEWDSLEAALYLKRGRSEIRDDFVEKPMSRMAAAIDVAFAQYAGENANNVVGALGTDPTDFTTFAAARQRMVELGAPMTVGKRGAIIAPQVNTAAVNAFKGLFQDDDEISRQYKEGTLGKFQGFRYFESTGLKNHTAGTWAGAVTVTTTAVSGATTLAVTCTNGDTFKKGDKIGIGGRYAVAPETKLITTRATTKQVTVLADVTASGTSATLSISPTLYGPDSPYQNIDVLPTASDALTLWPGTSSPNGKQGHLNIFVHSDAFAFLPVDLDLPSEGGSVEIAEKVTDPDTGVQIGFIRMFDGYHHKWINRFDCVYDFARLHSDAGAVVMASA